MFRAAELLTPFIPGAGILNAFDTILRVGALLPYIPELAHLSGKETPEIKDLHRSLGHLKTAYDSGDIEGLKVAAQNVQKHLTPLLESEAGYKQQFKAVGRLTSWNTYLQPLRTLSRELEKVEAGLNSSAGYPFDKLAAPLERGIAFVNKELNAHRGLADRKMKGVIDSAGRAVKEKFDEFRGVDAPKRKVRTPRPPLLRLMRDIANLRTGGARKHPTVIEKTLVRDLRSLEKSHPSFHGLTKFIRDNRLEKTSLIDSIDTLVTQFIVARFGRDDSLFNQKIYDFAVKKDSGIAVDGANAQQAYGQAFLGKTSMTKTEMEILWRAAAYRVNLDKLKSAKAALIFSRDTPLSEMSEKVDRALAYLSALGDIPEVSSMARDMTHIISKYGNAILRMVGNNLGPKDEALVNAAMDEHHHKLKAGDYEGSLLVLKALFESGVVARMAVASYETEGANSAVGDLATDFAVQAERAATEETTEELDYPEMIRNKKDELVESLTFFAAFKVVDNACKYTGGEAEDTAFQSRYKIILQQLGSLKGEARKTCFLELLKEQIEGREKLGGIAKWAAKRVSSITLKLVEYFSQHFADAMTAHLHAMALSPVQDPLTRNSFGAYKVANQALLALLAAEDQWRSDTTGALGIEGKEEKITAILSDPELNGGIDLNALTQQVVKKALNHFFARPGYLETSASLRNRLSVWGDRKGFFVKRALFSTVSGLGQLALFVGSTPVWIGKVISNQMQKTGTSFVISYLDVVNTVLSSLNDSVAYDKQMIGGINQVLLEQLKGVQKLLSEEGDGGVAFSAGKKEKRLVGELVSNLFKLIEDRRQLSPGEIARRDNMLSQLVDSFNNMTDEALQEIIRDLIILSYNAFQQEEAINSAFYGILDQANQALQPNDASKIWQLYSPEEQRALNADPTNPDTIQDLEGDFQNVHGRAFGELTNPEFSQILHDKYVKVEEDLHALLSDILRQVVKGVVEEQVVSLLKTPDDAITDYVTFLENQLIPHKQRRQTKRSATTYLEDMVRLSYAEDTQGLQKRHAKFLRQMQQNLQTMREREGKNERSDLQMHSLYRMTERVLNAHLKTLSDAITSGNQKEIRKQVRHLESAMRREEATLIAIRYAVETQEPTIADTLSEKAKQFLIWASHSASPVIATYVNSRLAAPVTGALDFLTTDPNAVRTIFREVVRGLMDNLDTGGEPSSLRERASDET